MYEEGVVLWRGNPSYPTLPILQAMPSPKLQSPAMYLCQGFHRMRGQRMQHTTESLPCPTISEFPFSSSLLAKITGCIKPHVGNYQYVSKITRPKQFNYNLVYRYTACTIVV